MNKTAIKNFAIWARNKLIAEITYKAGLLGITGDGVKTALPQSGNGTEYYDIGTKEPFAITGVEIKQRQDLVAAIKAKQAGTDYKSAYEQIIDEVAYTWFNRLIAIRFMEVNDYLPSRIRVLSSVSGKNEPDIVTTPFEAELDYTDAEKKQIIGWKNDEKLDEAFRYLFLKQCNELNAILPALFEKVSDYTELLLTVSFTDKDSVVYHLVHDIPEKDFDVINPDEDGNLTGQVEIIGWLYQYYNTEPKAKVFARASGTKIKKEEIPAATQLFTPDWIVRYMVENSLGRLWVEGHPNDKVNSGEAGREGGLGRDLKANWKYYLEEAEQEPEVQAKLAEIRKKYAALNPEDLLCIDPCMGSGHILCYFFDVLMQIYKSQGYGEREAAQSILEHNIWGLDIDDRAYQLAYFAVMMKARQYDRRILTRGIQPHVYAIVESNGFNKAQLKYFGATLDDFARNNALNQVNGLLEQLYDAKEYGSLLTVDKMDWALLREFAEHIAVLGQLDLDSIGVEDTQEQLKKLIDVGEALAQKYSVTCTNPPYMGSAGMDKKLSSYVKKYYPYSKSDMSTVSMERCMNFCTVNGYMAMINIPVWMFLSSYTKLRMVLLRRDTLINMVHPGRGIFGSDFGTTTFVIRRGYTTNYTGNYRRLFDRQGEVKSIEQREHRFLEKHGMFFAQQDDFHKIPGSPIAYWANRNLLDIFEKEKHISDLSRARRGLETGNNEKYLKLWYEVTLGEIQFHCDKIDKFNKTWLPHNKGGECRLWYGNRDYVVYFKNDGKAIRQSGALNGYDVYCKEGVTWTALTISRNSFRYTPVGSTFDSNKGPLIPQNQNVNVKYLLGVLNSKVAEYIVQLLNPTISLQNGDIDNIPIVLSQEKRVIDLVNQCIGYSKQDWDSFETSWDFQHHPLIRQVSTVSEAFASWSEECDVRFAQLKANEEELNHIFIDIYGLQDELTPEEEDKDVTVRKADLQRDIKSLLSYAVGCMFGRYSLDEKGLILAGQRYEGRFAHARVPVTGTGRTGAPESFTYRDGDCYLRKKDGGIVRCTFDPDRDGVIPLTDEEYFDDDIVGLFCAWLKKVYGADTLEKNLDFIAAALGSKGDTSREIIRNYFLNDFFKDHCQTYSVTGSGKRPIYWLYDSGKQNGFKALIYLHRYDADTTGRVRANYLHRMEKVYESEIGRMTEMMENSKNNREVAKATKRREKLQKQLKECREYDEKIAHLALACIEIDLDDGVKVNYRKVQTDKNSKFYEILADSKNIMAKQK